MHIPDGFLSAPVCAATGAAAVGAVGYSLRRLRDAVGDRLIPLMGVTSACIFAAQMVNFPVLAGTSGHLMGGVLAAVLLGPWAATVAMSVVLVVQCFLFYDGGVTALGANVLNLAVIGAMGGYVIYAPIRRARGGPAGTVAGAVLAAWVSVVLSAILCSVELAASGVYRLGTVLPAMTFVHSIIGVGEALVTGLVVSFVLRTRPDLIYGLAEERSGAVRGGQLVAAGLAVALVVAVFLSPLASSAPDGLERVAESIGLDRLAHAAADFAPMPDYEVPGLSGLWLATSLAGVAGVATVFAIAWGLGRALHHRRRA